MESNLKPETNVFIFEFLSLWTPIFGVGEVLPVH